MRLTFIYCCTILFLSVGCSTITNNSSLTDFLSKKKLNQTTSKIEENSFSFTGKGTVMYRDKSATFFFDWLNSGRIGQIQVSGPFKLYEAFFLMDLKNRMIEMKKNTWPDSSIDIKAITINSSVNKVVWEVLFWIKNHLRERQLLSLNEPVCKEKIMRLYWKGVVYFCGGDRIEIKITSRDFQLKLILFDYPGVSE